MSWEYLLIVGMGAFFAGILVGEQVVFTAVHRLRRKGRDLNKMVDEEEI